VHVLGDCPTLGAWQLSGSLPLTTTNDSWPLFFSSRPVLLPAGVPLRYRYCVIAEGRLVRTEDVRERSFLPSGA
jgi:hypothetical protein